MEWPAGFSSSFGWTRVSSVFHQQTSGHRDQAGRRRKGTLDLLNQLEKELGRPYVQHVDSMDTDMGVGDVKRQEQKKVCCKLISFSLIQHLYLYI
jgi:hypothetical protein